MHRAAIGVKGTLGTSLSPCCETHDLSLASFFATLSGPVAKGLHVVVARVVLATNQTTSDNPRADVDATEPTTTTTTTTPRATR